MGAREDSGSVTWWSAFLQSWASSTLDVYKRHLRYIRQRSLRSPGHSSTQIPKDYILELFRSQLTSSDMRQAISACRMLEEMGIANNFFPRAVWRAVRAKDRCGNFRARGWGSLAAVWTMAQAAESDEDVLVYTSAILATTFCLRISESASIRVQDLDPPRPRFHASIKRHVGAGSPDRPVLMSSGSWVSREQQPSGSGVSLSSRSSRGARKCSKHRWSDYSGHASTTTCAGTVGGDLERRYLSDMEQLSKSYSHGGGGPGGGRPGPVLVCDTP